MLLAVAGTVGACAAYAVPTPTGAAAADPDSTDTGRSQPGGLEEVTVTARKRAESLQDTPVAVSAFSGDALEARGIQSVSDIGNYVPNLQFDSVASEGGGGASSQIAIRGIGQNDYVLTVEPAVGMYLDGVYIGKSMGSLMDTLDLEQVAVLRGPQGTLFGRNTLAGAVQLTSRRPTNDFELNASATTGSYDRADGKVTVSGPLGDSVRARFSGAYLSRDGFEKRLSPYDGQDTGGRQGNQHSLSGRAVVDADLASNVLASWTVDGTRIREESPAQVLVFANTSTNGFAGFHNYVVNGAACGPDAGAPTALANPVCWNSQWTHPIDSLINTNTGHNRNDTDVIGTSLTLDVKDTGIGDFKSISAYRNVHTNVFWQMNGDPYYFNELGNDIHYDEISQEFQLNGKALDERLAYTLGLYYLKEGGDEIFPVDLQYIQFVSGGAIDNQSYAAFVSFTYDLTDRLSLTAGARYSDDKHGFNADHQRILSGLLTQVNPDFFGAPGQVIFPDGWHYRKDTSTTPSATIAYKITDEVNTYATYSEGYKGGAFVMRYFPPINNLLAASGVNLATVNYDKLISYATPEKARNYEIGLKSELGRRARLNLAAFRMDYQDMQITIQTGFGGFVPVLVNGGSARMQGVEAELTLVPIDPLQIDASASYLDAKYTSFSPEVISGAATFVPIDQLKVPNAPKITSHLGATLDIYKGDPGKLSVRGDYSYRTGQYKEFSNDPSLFQKAYGILNASATFALSGGHWQFVVAGTNLTNVITIVSGVSNQGIGYSQATVSPPREWSLEAKYSL